MADNAEERRIRDEIEFARAVTAVLLAVRLNDAEQKAQDAYDRLATGMPGAQETA